jgi:hypothetical protein
VCTALCNTEPQESDSPVVGRATVSTEEVVQVNWDIETRCEWRFPAKRQTADEAFSGNAQFIVDPTSVRVSSFSVTKYSERETSYFSYEYSCGGDPPRTVTDYSTFVSVSVLTDNGVSDIFNWLKSSEWKVNTDSDVRYVWFFPNPTCEWRTVNDSTSGGYDCDGPIGPFASHSEGTGRRQFWMFPS